MKKTLSLLLALVMCLPMCACTNGAGKNEVDIYEATNNKMYCTEKDVYEKDYAYCAIVSFNSGEYFSYMSTLNNGTITVDPDSMTGGSFVIKGNTIVCDDGTVFTYDPKEQTFTFDSEFILYYIEDTRETN